MFVEHIAAQRRMKGEHAFERLADGASADLERDFA